MATNKAYISAGLPVPRDGTSATGTNKAYITAGLSPDASSGVSAAISGTVTTALESDIVAGGKTIIITLTNDTWVSNT